mgnify:CR=1 FL=1
MLIIITGKTGRNLFCSIGNKFLNKLKPFIIITTEFLGHRPMRIFLKRQEISLSKTTVHKYMNQILGLHARIMRKKPAYVHGTKNKIFPNLLKQDFHCTEPNRIWCTDFNLYPYEEWKKCVITALFLIYMTVV